MSRRGRGRRGHDPGPTWRCRACGIAWPCSVAKLLLLARYREDRPGLLRHLADLQRQATAALTRLTPGSPPGDLTDRFVSWARPE